ncbi:MAG TPA: hypothetical protein DHN33_02410 [Eubacteriaceae bacterium]|nr:hypothetical protein [Eubacteriaceae bacterium]
MKPKNLVIFDLDGTLIDSLAGIAYCANMVLEQHGFPKRSVDEHRLFVGSGLRELMRKAAGLKTGESTALLDTLYDNILQVYHENYTIYLTLYQDIDVLLRKLLENKISIAVNTNKNHQLTLKIIRHLFDPSIFCEIIGSNHGFERKPDPKGAFHIMEQCGVKAENTFYVGDTSVDLKTAQAAGITPITVTWGFRTWEELAPYKPPHRIDQPLDLLPFLNL